MNDSFLEEWNRQQALRNQKVDPDLSIDLIVPIRDNKASEYNGAETHIAIKGGYHNAWTQHNEVPRPPWIYIPEQIPASVTACEPDMMPYEYYLWSSIGLGIFLLLIVLETIHSVLNDIIPITLLLLIPPVLLIIRNRMLLKEYFGHDVPSAYPISGVLTLNDEGLIISLVYMSATFLTSFVWVFIFPLSLAHLLFWGIVVFRVRPQSTDRENDINDGTMSRSLHSREAAQFEEERYPYHLDSYSQLSSNDSLMAVDRADSESKPLGPTLSRIAQVTIDFGQLYFSNVFSSFSAQQPAGLEVLSQKGRIYNEDLGHHSYSLLDYEEPWSPRHPTLNTEFTPGCDYDASRDDDSFHSAVEEISAQNRIRL